jgi:hypothetical protein
MRSISLRLGGVEVLGRESFEKVMVRGTSDVFWKIRKVKMVMVCGYFILLAQRPIKTKRLRTS